MLDFLKFDNSARLINQNLDEGDLIILKTRSKYNKCHSLWELDAIATAPWRPVPIDCLINSQSICNK